jgi:hypothetical protein
MSRPVVPFRVLSRRAPTQSILRSSLNSPPLILLRTLCLHEKRQLLWNQANPHSLRKTAGVGGTSITRPLESPTCRPFLSISVCNKVIPWSQSSLAIFALRLFVFRSQFRSPFPFITLRIPFPACPPDSWRGNSFLSITIPIPGGVALWTCRPSDLPRFRLFPLQSPRSSRCRQPQRRRNPAALRVLNTFRRGLMT